MKNSKVLKCTLAVALVFGSISFISGCKKDDSSSEQTANSQWLSGNGAPNNDVGSLGDFYFDTTSKSVYKKDSNGWGMVTSFSDAKGILSVNKTSNDNVDTYTITYTDGSNYSFNVKNGVDATELDFRVSGGYLQWSYAGVNEWNNLVDINAIKGDSPVFEVNGNTIRWKYANENSWKELLDFSSFRGDKGDPGTSWTVGTGAPTITANVGDYYYDTLNNDIYLYSLSGWILQADLDTDKSIPQKLTDGVYTGIINGSEFVLEISDDMVSRFNISDLNVENIYNVSIEYEVGYIRIFAFIAGGSGSLEQEYIEERFVLKQNNRLVKYIEDDEMELFKGIYYNEASTPLTLSKNSFAYLYNGIPLTGEWEIVDVVKVMGVTKHKLLLKSENISFYAFVSYFDRTWQENDVVIDFTSKEYVVNDSSIIVLENNDGYYATVDSNDKAKVNLYTFSDNDSIAYIVDDNNISYVIDYIRGTAYRSVIVKNNFFGKTLSVNVQNYRKQYYFDEQLNEFVPKVDSLLYSNDYYDLEYNGLNNRLTIYTKQGIRLLSVSFDSFTQDTINHYKYVDSTNMINLYFNEDKTLREFSLEEIDYAECQNEEDLVEAINNEHEFIKIMNDFMVSKTIEITKGKFVIDLNGYIISSGVNYLDGSIIKVEGNGEDSVDVKIKNGYLGNYTVGEGEVVELLETSVAEGNISKYGIVINVTDNTSISLENMEVSGYSSGLFTGNSNKRLSSTINIKNSKFVSSSTSDNSSVGAFLGSYANYVFNNSSFEGATGIYAKSGRVTLINCSVVADGNKVDAQYNETGFVATGSALVLDSSYGFSKPLNVSISGGNFTSANSYPIEKVLTAPVDLTVDDYASVNGQISAELYSAVYGTFDTFVDYNYSYVVNEDELRYAINIGKKNIVLKADIKLANTILINEGEYVIDLNGYILSSATDYNTDAIIRIEDDIDDVNENINVTIKNGYVGNFVRDDVLVNVLKTNTASGNIARQGIAVNGSRNTIVNIENVKAAGYETGFATNGLDSFVNATINVVDSEFISSMEDPKDGAGAYLASYAIYNFNRVKFVGASGLYAKSGELNLVNCTVTATGDKVDPKYGGNGYWPTGSALVVDSAFGYVKPLNVTINGGAYTSANSYSVQQISTAPVGSSVEVQATISGINSATLNGEVSLLTE